MYFYRGERVNEHYPPPSLDAYKKLGVSLKLSGNDIVSVKENLIDAIWEDQPSKPTGCINPLALEFTGSLSGVKYLCITIQYY